MYAQCPSCQTIFRVSASALQVADGTVRCGQCQETFNALAHLMESLPGEAPAATPPLLEEDELEMAFTAKPPPAPEPAAPAFNPSLDLAAAFDSTSLEAGIDLPGEPSTEEAKGRGGAGAALWSLGALILLLALPLQFAHQNRLTLAESDAMRPWIEKLCGLTGCQLPLRRDLAALSLGEREVRSHPEAADALLIQGTLTNKAFFPQPYPVLEVTLSNLAGGRVAMRRFRPHEYLESIETDIDAGLPARGSARIRLDVVDPGREAVSFTFDFR